MLLFKVIAKTVRLLISYCYTTLVKVAALQKIIESAQVLVAREVVSHLINLVLIYPQHSAVCNQGVVTRGGNQGW